MSPRERVITIVYTFGTFAEGCAHEHSWTISAGPNDNEKTLRDHLKKWVPNATFVRWFEEKG